MKRLTERLKEPSTWAGLGAILGPWAAMGGTVGTVLAALAGSCGAVAVVLREGAK